MATRQPLIPTTDRDVTRRLYEIGRELRLARMMNGIRQTDVGRRIRASGAQVSRIENGRATSVTVRQLAHIGAVVGLRISVRAYPVGRRLVDGGQLVMFDRVKALPHRYGSGVRKCPCPSPATFVQPMRSRRFPDAAS